MFTTKHESANRDQDRKKDEVDLKVEIMLAHLVPDPNQVVQSDLKPTNDISSSPPPPTELKSLPSHLKYAYLGHDQQHKKAIRWKLSDLPSINPSICMNKILMEEEARPIRQQQRRLSPTVLVVIKKEVTKLLAVGIYLMGHKMHILSGPKKGTIEQLTSLKDDC
ncbi:hypothetical protein CR513_32238, partial [Mucuna pruriens]